MTSWQKIVEMQESVEKLRHACSILGADEAIHMSIKGGEKRAACLSYLQGQIHQKMSDPQLLHWIDQAAHQFQAEEYEFQRRELAELKQAAIHAQCLDTAFVQKKVGLSIRCEQLWRQLRAKNDWANFVPLFSEVIKMVQEEAQRRGEALRLDPYDALMELYDPGHKAAWITPLFQELKNFLRPLIPLAAEESRQRKALHPFNVQGPFSVDKQKNLAALIMKKVGFDFERGRLDISHHPFCGGVPTDIRMTTRYSEEHFAQGLMGVLHETGHAKYEQHLPLEWSHLQVGQARGMAIHESQSLFLEMQIGRSVPFIHYLASLLPTIFPEELKNLNVEGLIANYQSVSPGAIRVDADEVTYPMHVILRYEMEQELIHGKLDVAQIPEQWNAKMKAYLGIDVHGDYKNGCMQDVHWPSGAFGYFPSYTMGAIISAQLMEAVEKAIPNLSSQLRQGQLQDVDQWLEQNLWRWGSYYSTEELLMKSTGKKLDIRPFCHHLQKRYGPKSNAN